MTNRTTGSRPQIAEEAAAWFARFREGGELPDRVRRDFVDWILESPVHVHEYLAIAELWGDVEGVCADGEFAIDDLLALGAGDENVVPLDVSGTDEAPRSAANPAVRRYWIGGVAAGIVVGAIAGVLGISLNWTSDEPATTYRTGLGEQRSIVLNDGSIVELNTLTEIEVLYLPDERRVTLLSGEALFDVEENRLRPFIVDAGSAAVRVLGTRFNIYRSSVATEVTVLEGKVAIERTPAPDDVPNALDGDDAGRGAIELIVGEQARVEPRRPEIATATLANVEPITAWTERRLIFEATPLADIVAQFNRYNTNQLRLADAQLSRLELSGVFGSNDPESLIEFLHRVQDIAVAEQPDGTLVIDLRESVIQR